MDKMKHNPFWGESEKPVIYEWYHIKATITCTVDRIITFWLWGDSESDIKNKVLTKGYYKDIQWIRQEEPPFS